MLQIVIPTYNAAAHLPDLLAQLTDETVIIADGGSEDATLVMALQAGARLAIGTKGRGSQLRAGAELARLSGAADDWFLFLHADSRLHPDWRRAVETAMRENASRYFPFRADASSFRARLVEIMVALRLASWGKPYGDQGLLISRSDYEKAGGYPRWPLFEDVAMIDKLASLKPLSVPIYADISKHLNEGIIRRGIRNLRIYRRFKSGESPTDLLKDYGA